MESKGEMSYRFSRDASSIIYFFVGETIKEF
jgi:hypothetical protein